ncbi:hypothetical protein GGR54DRAFT_228499 [Hypoxylon sp. NC1633]|nr:hypothetical protein GGR54DRAFT_228499 [Hypoxylon sp. NC1633]
MSHNKYQPASSQGKNYAPEGITRPIYRASDGLRAQQYFEGKDSRDIITQKPAGDFHTSNQQAAYFTYDKEYAKILKPVGGKIIRQDVPREMLRNGYKFDDVPDDNWYHLVEKCRRNERAEGSMRRVQKMDIIEGPVAHTSTRSIVGVRPPTPKQKFKPYKRGDEYVQQVVFKGDALESLTRLKARETF